MKFSLRSLLLATILLPPLLAWGWRFVEAALTPEAVYPCQHRVRNVDWQQATMQVKSLGPPLSDGFRAKSGVNGE